MRNRREFNRCQKFGKRTAGRWLVIFATPNAGKAPRLGLAVSRKAGSAVVRNRLKRRLRESFRRGRAAGGLAASDFCVSVRPGAGSVPFRELDAEFWSLARKASSRS